MEDKYNIKQLVIFIIVILLILGIFYGITVFVTDKKNKSTINNNVKNNEYISIDYDTILVEKIFSQKEDVYYVIATFSNDEKVSSYNSKINSLKEKNFKFYNIDLDSAFNKNYVKEESNFDEEYPIFSKTTLLKIEKGKISDVYEEDNIEEVLTKLETE